MIELVSTNPTPPVRPLVPPSEIARLAARTRYLAHANANRVSHRLKIDADNFAAIVVWPTDLKNARWALLQHSQIGGRDILTGGPQSFPTALAAFEHGAATIRAGCAEALPEHPEDAAAILTWVNHLEPPL